MVHFGKKRNDKLPNIFYKFNRHISFYFDPFYKKNYLHLNCLAVDPVRILIAVCLFSNIGGAATSVGDPPNVLIANDPK